MNKKKHISDLLSVHRQEFLAYLAKKLPNEADALDVMQEAYVKLQAASTLDTVEKPKAYIYRVIANLAFDRIKQNQRVDRHAAVSLDSCTNLAERQPAPDSVVHYRRELRQLQRALAELTHKCRMSFILHRAEGYTYKEIGEKLGISESMVKKYVLRALVHCRTYMRQQEAGEQGQ
ncbi:MULTISPECIES: RNA polymerase sigma factor [Kordiimonas]|uniref:RNA polymerase sigma factor n=1 Tax=Kordiimonas TaxID=288021 RepID=UPI00257A0836|nr:sigma-70 family RNA polymerase sigma factor [Kordiimonas sp. UBA4487]